MPPLQSPIQVASHKIHSDVEHLNKPIWPFWNDLDLTFTRTELKLTLMIATSSPLNFKCKIGLKQHVSHSSNLYSLVDVVTFRDLNSVAWPGIWLLSRLSDKAFYLCGQFSIICLLFNSQYIAHLPEACKRRFFFYLTCSPLFAPRLIKLGHRVVTLWVYRIPFEFWNTTQ